MTYLAITLYHRIGMIGAIFECVYVSSDFSQITCHPFMQSLHVMLIVKTSGHA